VADPILSHEKSLSSSPRAAIYARVSTLNHGQDVTMQTRELREYCERRGWNVAAEFVDLGISGSKDRRPELDKLMSDARRRRFDVIVVWRFDRFARSVRHPSFTGWIIHNDPYLGSRDDDFLETNRHREAYFGVAGTLSRRGMTCGRSLLVQGLLRVSGPPGCAIQRAGGAGRGA
jgi:hypothetical protein